MTDTPSTLQAQDIQKKFEALSNEERLFVQKVNNAGLAVSFTPQNSDKKMTFLPSDAQIRNAKLSRTEKQEEEGKIPYITLLEEKAAHPDIAIISAEESEQVPFMPSLREIFFSSLPEETKVFVLKCNLSGLNVTAKGNNDKSFLYLAPQNDQSQDLMRQELALLQSPQGNALSTSQKVSQEPSNVATTQSQSREM